MSEDIWNHLSEAGITPSEEEGTAEFDRHSDVLNIEKSYFFGCLKFSDGCIAYKIYVTVDRQRNCEVGIDEMLFPQPIGLGAQAKVDHYTEIIRAVFRSFCDGRSELT